MDESTDQNLAPLTDEELRETAANGWAPHGARLATELLAARARIIELDEWRTRLVDQARRAIDDVDRWNRLYQPSADYPRPDLADLIDRALDDRDSARARVAELENFADRVRAALDGHPRCEIHPDDDVIGCGWKRAVASVQWAVDHAALDAMPASVEHDRAGEIETLRARVTELEAAQGELVGYTVALRAPGRGEPFAGLCLASGTTYGTADHAREVAERDGGLPAVVRLLAGAELEAQQGEPIGYAVAVYPGAGLPPLIEDVHPTREGAEGEAAELREIDSFTVDRRVYELREVRRG